MSESEDRRRAMRERTKRYASAIIGVYCDLPKHRTECQVLGKQFLRSGTSVAANYREASRARSDAEFVSKIDICCQEADETVLWSELLEEDCHIDSDRLRWVKGESNELLAMLTSASRKVKQRR